MRVNGRVNVRFVCRGAFVACCFACGCVLELVVCRVRFARVSCPRLRFCDTLPRSGRTVQLYSTGRVLCSRVMTVLIPSSKTTSSFVHHLGRLSKAEPWRFHPW